MGLLAINANNSIYFRWQFRVAVFRVAVVLGGSCPGDSCPRWQLSWVAIVLGDSGPGGSCPDGCSSRTKKLAISGDHSRSFPNVFRKFSASIPHFPKNCWDSILQSKIFDIISKAILTWWCIATTNHWSKSSTPTLSVTNARECHRLHQRVWQCGGRCP